MLHHCCMNEDYLQYIWRFQHLPAARLQTTSGKEIHVLFQGHWNRNAGPDFFEAKLRIGRELWIGSVEVHVKSSEWHKHGHSGDPAYRNVILHVVLEDDKPLVNAAGEEVPTLVLKEFLDASLYERYCRFIGSPEMFPCSGFLPEVSQAARAAWLHRMAVERLENRSKRFAELLLQYRNDWNALWWQTLCRAFGFGVNQVAFEILATSLPWQRLARIAHRNVDLEAVLCVHSSWNRLDKRLSEAIELEERYLHYSRMWEVSPIPRSAWRKGKMKPANHPRVRLGQLVALVASGAIQWQRISSADDLSELRSVFAVQKEVSYLRMKAQCGPTERIGKQAVDRLLANAVLPLRFYHSRIRGDQVGVQQALDWFDVLKPEDHRIARQWKRSGWGTASMLESQGQLHLFRQYCSLKKCLSCSIGVQALKPKPP